MSGHHTTRHVSTVFQSVLDYLKIDESIITATALADKFFQVFPQFPISKLPLTQQPMVHCDDDSCCVNSSNTITNNIIIIKQAHKSKPEGFSLSGYAGSGKSTVADMLVELLGCQTHAFAAALKDVTAYLFGLDRASLEGDTKQSREWREQPLADWSGLTARVILQRLGTEVFRSLHDDIWLEVLTNRLTGKVVITDARFVNELQLCHDLGLTTVVVKRPGVGPQSSHPSETSHTGWKFDVYIDNDGDLQQLKSRVLTAASEVRAL